MFIISLSAIGPGRMHYMNIGLNLRCSIDIVLQKNEGKQPCKLEDIHDGENAKKTE